MGDDSTPPPDADSVEAAGLETAGADAGASGAERRALMRKVAQLTKVVMHLNSKNDESEQQYQLLSEELEEEVTAIVEGAAMEIQAETLKVKDLAEKSSLLANASRLEQLFGQQKLQLAAELRQLHAGAQQLKQRQREMAELDLEVTIQKVREVSQKLRESLENYRRTLERRALEMAQRHEELRSDRVVELQLFQEDFDRRLEDLKTSLRREAEHARQSTEHAMLHMRRLHEAETSSQQLALLQRRQERMQRLEHDFAEERRAREAARSGMELEMMQQRKDLEDFKASLFSVDQQVEAMRGTLEEMRCRAERASCDADLARSEAAQAEAETAALAREIALLEVRHRGAAPPAPAVPAVPPAPRAPRPPRNGLTEELREVISNTKQVENEMALVEARLGDLEDELAEQDKTVEILEVETEEERLRTHRLQTRILQLESHLS